MTNYVEPILNAIFIFPFIAALFTTPYVLYQYHKYGAIPIIRILIVYSFILYLTCSYFLIILPLPKIEDVLLMTTPRYQLIPFQFIKDIINNTQICLYDIKTYYLIFKEPWIYQIIYNILLTLPFGIYLRYYFECNLKKTILYSFLLSLFFELTQLSGLYGIYPRGYRLFDVDDLMVNTLGGILGYFLAGILTFLPTRDKLDELSYKKGSEVSGLRRMITFFCDLFLFSLFSLLFTFLANKIYPVSFLWYLSISIFIYYTVIPFLLNGQTLMKRFLNSKIETKEGKKPKFYQLFIRTFVLFFVLLPIPFYVATLFIWLIHYFQKNDSYRYFLFGGFCFTEFFVLLYYLYCILLILKKKPLLHERISKTKIVSTIIWNEENTKIEEKI